MSKKLWIYSVVTFKNAQISYTVGLIFAETHEAAIGEVTLEGKDRYPNSEGYAPITVDVKKVERHLIVRAYHSLGGRIE